MCIRRWLTIHVMQDIRTRAAVECATSSRRPYHRPRGSTPAQTSATPIPSVHYRVDIFNTHSAEAPYTVGSGPYSQHLGSDFNLVASCDRLRHHFQAEITLSQTPIAPKIHYILAGAAIDSQRKSLRVGHVEVVTEGWQTKHHEQYVVAQRIRATNLCTASRACAFSRQPSPTPVLLGGHR